MEEVKPVVMAKYEFECRDKSSLIAQFDFADCQNFDERNKMKNFSFLFFARSVILSIATLVKSLKPVDTGNGNE